jgi:hypothetical protein
MALAAAQNVTIAGLTPAYAAPGALENIIPDDGLVLHVKNTNAALTLVGIVDPTLSAAGSAATAPSISVPATTGDKFIPLSRKFFNPATGFIVVSFSNVAAGVVAALLKFPLPT